MKASKIMLFSVLVLGLPGCSAPQTSENTSPLIRSQTSSEPQKRLSVVWGVLLNTFDGLGHEMAAQRMAQTCRSMSPILNNTWIHSKRRGSSVLIGRFRSADDPAARRCSAMSEPSKGMVDRSFLDPCWFGLIPENVQKILGRWNSSGSEVRSPIRRCTPCRLKCGVILARVNFQPRRFAPRAEEACARLRREGWTAYVHHEVDRVISSVTVGLYDNRSIDAESGLDLDAALIRARKRFPHHLVNGEELQEPIDPRRPALGTRRQAPQLVEVPKL